MDGANIDRVTSHSRAGGREIRARPGSITTNAPLIRSPSSDTTFETASPSPRRALPGKRVRRTPAVWCPSAYASLPKSLSSVRRT
jgi:hypothetical protein